jgi:Tfp pilus assembly protein PilV
MHDVKNMFRRLPDKRPTDTNKPRDRSLCGFTLVEVMLGSIVMVLAITTAITTLQQGFLSLDTARKLTLAGQILQCEVEKMRMVPWATINAYPTTPTDLTIDTTFTSNPAVGNKFTLSRNVVTLTTGTTAGMKEITYTVNWKTVDGRTLSRSYVTYYGEKGLYDYYFNSI